MSRRRWSAPPRTSLPKLWTAIGPEVELGLTRQVCTAQLEQQTGLEIRQEWLTEPLPTYRVPEPHDLYGNVDGADRA